MLAFTSRHALALLALGVCQLLIQANFVGANAGFVFGDGAFEGYLLLSQLENSLGLIVAMFVAGIVARQGFLPWALLTGVAVFLLTIKAVYDIGAAANPSLSFWSLVFDHLTGLAGIVVATVVGVLSGQWYYRTEISGQNGSSTYA